MVARGVQRLRAAGVPETEIPSALKAVEEGVKERGPGAHPLTGPIWIEGAEPGDTLEVKILGFEFLHPYGVSGFVPTAGTLPDEFPHAATKLIRLDAKAGTAEFSPGIRLKIAPFFGSIGVAPDPLVGRISSGPPGHHAGNLDNKELVAGSRLACHAVSGRHKRHSRHDREVDLHAVEQACPGRVLYSRRGCRAYD